VHSGLLDHRFSESVRWLGAVVKDIFRAAAPSLSHSLRFWAVSLAGKAAPRDARGRFSQYIIITLNIEEDDELSLLDQILTQPTRHKICSPKWSIFSSHPNTIALSESRELGFCTSHYCVDWGLLTGKYHKDPALLEKMTGIRKAMFRRDLERTRPLIAVMDEIAGRHDATIAQVALNWLIHFNGDIVVAIPGATKVHQAEESAGAMKFRLTDEELGLLSETSLKL
jgi:aryl-alcohol dehydrogenase-like predicted oxidoreductase